MNLRTFHQILKTIFGQSRFSLQSEYGVFSIKDYIYKTLICSTLPMIYD